MAMGIYGEPSINGLIYRDEHHRIWGLYGDLTNIACRKWPFIVILLDDMWMIAMGIYGEPSINGLIYRDENHQL